MCGLDVNRVPKTILKTNPKGIRSTGRQKGRWCDATNLNLRTAGVTNRETLAADMPDWRSILGRRLNGL